MAGVLVEVAPRSSERVRQPRVVGGRAVGDASEVRDHAGRVATRRLGPTVQSRGETLTGTATYHARGRRSEKVTTGAAR